jgi:hypothetical protein
LYRRATRETADVPPGAYLITPEGQPLGRIPTLEDLCTNPPLGGPGRRALLVTASEPSSEVPLAVSDSASYPP